MCHVIQDMLVMSEEEFNVTPSDVIHDLLHRVRKVEADDVKSRVYRLEMTIETVQRDLRDMRDEQRASDLKTERSFKELSTKFEDSMKGLTDRVNNVVIKVAMWTGGIVVVSVFATKTDILATILG